MVSSPGTRREATMETAIASEEAVLWRGGEAIAQGTLSRCIRDWIGLPRGHRANSYIQLRRSAQKRVLRPHDLYRIAASELASGPDA
jgi:hypothetical protein